MPLVAPCVAEEGTATCVLERNRDRLEGKDFSIHLVMSPLINQHILINYILFIPRL